jgi:8-oxo-dGTP diphosphatase
MSNPRVGVAVIVKRDNEILLGYRKSELGKNTWGLPGGKLEFGEELIDCAIRELKEETNLIVKPKNLRLVGISNAVFDDDLHYITVIYSTKKFKGELTILEPNKCESWEWFDYYHPPKDLFLPLKNFFKDKKIIKD